MAVTGDSVAQPDPSILCDVTDAALFIRWGQTAGGRERESVELFADSLRYLTGLVEQGRVASVEPFFLEPHGGDLEGFFIVRGDLEELNRLRIDDSFQRLATKAQVIVRNFGVIGATTGERLNKHMAWFAAAAGEVDARH